MEYRRLGATDIDLSVIGYSCYGIGDSMWGNARKKDVVSAIRASLDHGVNTINTAPFYGLGESESLVGEAIKGQDRSGVRILSKFGMVWDGSNKGKGEYYFDLHNQGQRYKVYKLASRENLLREVEHSLKRMQVDHIDLLQLHCPDRTTPLDETMEALEMLAAQGKIRAAGVCNCPVADMEKAGARPGLASGQVQYSMLNREAEAELIPLALRRNIGIIVNCPLERGLLSGAYFDEQRPVRPGYQDCYFQRFNLRRVRRFLDALKPIAADHGATLSQLALKWTTLQPGVTSVVEGAVSKAQAVSNAKAIGLRLGVGELDLISHELNKLTAAPSASAPSHLLKLMI